MKTDSPKLRKAILSNVPKDLLHCISEGVLNVLKFNIHLTPCTKRRLRKCRATLRSLVDKRLSRSGKARVIVQRRGFLLPLLTAVLPILAGLLLRPKATNTQ